MYQCRYQNGRSKKWHRRTKHKVEVEVEVEVEVKLLTPNFKPLPSPLAQLNKSIFGRIAKIFDTAEAYFLVEKKVQKKRFMGH